MNPVEGVMCWACYTPLTGGASAVGAGAGAAAKLGGPPGVSGPPDLEEKPKAKVSPVQMGVIGVALVVLLGMGLRSMSGPALPDDPPNVLPEVPGGTRGGAPVIPSRPGQPPSQGPAGGTTATAPAGEPMAYSVTTPPSVKSTWATVGIVPADANTDSVMAGRIASLAHQRYSKTGQWDGIYVYAFADKQTAAVFQKYQQDRRGAALEPGDYQSPALQSIWPKTLARYEFSKGQEAIRYPQANPTAWFEGQSQWSKAAR
jgi:hypothetical protein